MKVSVIIPVYNVEAYISRCLDSVFYQTYEDYEVICVNDGSTDASLQLLETCRNNHPNMTIVSIPNGGQANARNLGVELAKGEFVCFLDSDDYIDTHMLEVLVKIQEHDFCDMVVCGIDRIFEDGVSMLEKKFKYDAELEEKHAVTIYDYPKMITLINNSPFSKLIRKSILIKNEIKFPVGYIYEDFAFTHNLLATGLTVSIINDKIYKYIVRKGSTMTSKNSNIEDIFPMYQSILDVYESLGLTEQFKVELDYLGLYHIGIGTSYRLFRNQHCGLFAAIKKCRSYLKQMDCNKHNKYINRKSLLVSLFVRIFM